MNTNFFKQLLSKQQHKEAVPSNEIISGWALNLICLLYPELSLCSYSSIEEIEDEFKKLEGDLVKILNATVACRSYNNEEIGRKFFEKVPHLYRILNTDIYALLTGDPA